MWSVEGIGDGGSLMRLAGKAVDAVAKVASLSKFFFRNSHSNAKRKLPPGGFKPSRQARPLVMRAIVTGA